MKVLCATDFSKASVNAIDWTYRMLSKIGDAELSIIHCISNQRRSDILLSVTDILRERADNDIQVILKRYPSTDKLRVKAEVQIGHPKTKLSILASKHKYDLIVTGSTGLTSLKDMTVGSFSQYLMAHSEVPVLVIPPEVTFKSLERVVISLGKTEVKNIERLNFMYELFSPFNSHISFVQVIEPNTHAVTVDPRISEYLKDLEYDFETIEKKGSINASINHYCSQVHADLVCMIHQQRSWFQQMFHHSITKDELFIIELPFLVIPD